MVKLIGSSRRKTRQLFSVPKKMKGKLPVTGFVHKMQIGEYVHLSLQPSILEGIYYRRFHGRTGRIVGMQGNCYMVEIREGGKQKTLIVGPVHLKKAYAAVKVN